MNSFPFHMEQFCFRRWVVYFAAFACTTSLWTGGCHKTKRTDDPQLEAIQQVLDAHVPPGTPEEKVRAFLKSRGCVELPPQRPGTLVAIIPPAEAARTQAVARVTFYFDANGKLNTFELQRATEGSPPR
jgi:hypothetical protein